MSEREVWAMAGAIVAKHGALTADFIIKQLGEVLGDRVSVEDWRRVAAAADQITDASSGRPN